ncbi:MAG: L-2-hydroxyglutarate oxidase [Planctomycetes bacterium]|nr:L-2-hydroxyglutarate oxidase [Planctomycetota bacterium]
MDRYDLIIIGGGVIGVAAARAAAKKRSGLSICLLEKESELAAHQSGRNSGVAHAGYIPKPGTLKAKFVVEGSRRLRAFCRDRAVPLVEDGILVVGRRDQERTLRELIDRGTRNGAQVEWVEGTRLRELESHARAECGVFAREGASFDARAYVRALSREAGADIALSEPALRCRETSRGVEIQTPRRTLSARALLNAAGLHADRIAHQFGVGRQYAIVPFRGEYWELTGPSRDLVRSHLYPCPDLRFPFLGVHLSRKTNGRVVAGPGAVLAPGREAYRRFEFGGRDVLDMVRWRGLRRMAQSSVFRELVRREWRKSLFPSAVLAEIRRLVPEVRGADLTPYPSGIRAQLVSREGDLVDDLVVLETARTVHVLNAVSPALTCSLPFADYLERMLQDK